MASNFEKDLTKGNVGSQLILFSLPYMLSSFIQALYSTADMYIVGQCCTTASVTGVANGGQVQMLLVFFVLGLSIGGTILIAQYKGAGRQQDVTETIGTILTVLMLASVVVSVLSIAFSSQLLNLINTPEQAFDEAQRYFNILMLGTPFVFGYNAVSAVLRGVGDSKRPLVFVLIACVLNVGLDVLFVGVFGWNASGAAIATIAAQAVSLLLAVIYLSRSDFAFDFRIRSFRIHADKLKKLLKVGAPMGIQSFITNSSFLVMTAIVNDFGTEASAAMGIYGRYNSFAILPAIAIGQSVSAMVAQNYGARQLKRATKTMWVGVGISFVCSVAMFAVFQTLSGPIMALFSEDTEVIRYGVEYMRTVSFDLLVIPLVFCMMNFVNGVGRTTFSMICNIMSALLLRIPISLLLGKTLNMGVSGVGLGVPIASAGTILLLAGYLLLGRWKKDKLMERKSGDL